MATTITVAVGSIKTVRASNVPGDDLRRVTRSTDAAVPVGSLVRPLSSGTGGATLSVIRSGR